MELFVADFLGVFQLVFLMIILYSSITVWIMVYEIYKISKFSKEEFEKKKIPTKTKVKCPKCGTLMEKIYDGKIVNGYICPKCGFKGLRLKGKEKEK